MNRKPVCDFLLVIELTSYFVTFRSYRSYSDFGHCVFEPPFGGLGLGTTYDVHLGLNRKRVANFLVLIELFSLGVTAEALRAKRSKIGDFAPTRSA